jgi:hypothetical protein
MTKRPLIALGSLVAVAAIVLAGVLLLAPGESSLARAAGTMQDQSARLQLNMKMSEGGEEATIEGPMVINAAGDRGHMDVDFAMQGEMITMTGLIVGKDMWFTSPQLAPLLPEGKRWVHMVENSPMPETLSMSEFEGFLRGADEIDEKGETTIRGQKVTHYEGKVDLRELAEQSDGKMADQLVEMLEGQEVMIPLEAWIGDDGRPVRIHIICEGRDGSADMTVDVLEWGVPVDVEPPPESQTIEESEFDQLTTG